MEEGGGPRVSTRVTVSAGIEGDERENSDGNNATICTRETTGVGEIVVSGLSTMTQLQAVGQAKTPASTAAGWRQRISRLLVGFLQQQ